ncbi:MAG: histidinol-phosphatase [Roseiflexaceae bacterium]
MTNREIAAVLFNISTILSTQNGNPYRIRAYRRAARNLLRIREPIAQRVADGRPLGLPRLGKSLTAKISSLARKDALQFYTDLCEELPVEESTLLKLNVPGLGPTIAARIHRDLGPTDAASLRRAAATGKLQRVWGIGPKRTAAILDAVGGSEARQERFEI